jgi:hypothetical protein
MRTEQIGSERRIRHMRSVVLLLGLAALLVGCPKDERPAVLPGANVEAPPLPPTLEGGLPIRVELPPGAQTDVRLEEALPTQQNGMNRTWTVPFSYTEGFDAAVAHFDTQFKSRKYSRIGGPNTDKDPGVRPGNPAPPSTAQGQKTWIAEDRMTVVFLRYTFKRDDDGSAHEHSYQLDVMTFNEPAPVNEPSRIEPIP